MPPRAQSRDRTSRARSADSEKPRLRSSITRTSNFPPLRSNHAGVATDPLGGIPQSVRCARFRRRHSPIVERFCFDQSEYAWASLESGKPFGSRAGSIVRSGGPARLQRRQTRSSLRLNEITAGHTLNQMSDIPRSAGAMNELCRRRAVKVTFRLVRRGCDVPVGNPVAGNQNAFDVAARTRRGVVIVFAMISIGASGALRGHLI